jgi:hypothetical protein
MSPTLTKIYCFCFIPKIFVTKIYHFYKIKRLKRKRKKERKKGREKKTLDFMVPLHNLTTM